MNRRNFASKLAAVGIPTCLLVSRAKGEEKPPRHLKVLPSPTGLPLLRSFFPEKMFSTNAVPEPTVHPQMIHRQDGETNRDFRERRGRQARAYSNAMRIATIYSDRWSLPSSEESAMAAIEKELRLSIGEAAQLRYDTYGDSLPRVVGINVVGGRQFTSAAPVSSPSDLVGTESPEISLECFDRMSSLKVLDNVFLNFGRCDFELLLRWAASRKKTSSFGIPLDLEVEQLGLLLKKTTVEVLDLSGYENRDSFAEMIVAASKNGVGWIIVSEFINFSLRDLKLDLANIDGSLRGIVGVSQVGLFI